MPDNHDSGGDRADREVLEERGWTQVGEDPERYVGYFEQDGRRIAGGVQLVEDGPPRLYVKALPEAFVENAGSGQSLERTAEAADDAYLVVFEEERVPATMADGFETVRSMMTDTVDSGDGDELDRTQDEGRVDESAASEGVSEIRVVVDSVDDPDDFRGHPPRDEHEERGDE